MKTIIPDLKKHFDGVVNALKEELKAVRTSHASPALLENIEVEAYGGAMKMKLMELATITNEGPTTLAIIPFDPTLTQDIEKAIRKSPLGLSPTTQTSKILIMVPSLSTEQRAKYVKLVNEMAEKSRTSVRGNRDDARKKIRNAFEAKELSEDEKYRLEKQVDEETQKVNEQLQIVREKKEKEITTV
ncbi:MAG TPA: ribosome-recycling factor [Candidatus Woesebacteria bacterium]|nr:ribosome-recycling factor [Candidatus Woesebacteria bacterium]HNS94420.1 ribosome-recycling factor [Candidatus Woesebacteria bacterium]